MSKKRWTIPEENLFLSIKKARVEAKERGVGPIVLSIGQPEGPALLSARTTAAEAIMSNEESMHEYQDNGSPGCPDFAQKFVQAHVPVSLAGIPEIGFLPIPGIKPMLPVILLSCLNDYSQTVLNVCTMTEPGYPTPAYWGRKFARLGIELRQLALKPQNEFLPSLDQLDKQLMLDAYPNNTKLFMANLPGNPAGQIATREWWEEVCTFCEIHGIRIFNDAAYAMLDHFGRHCPLASVAIGHPGLSWLEAYSASKEINNGTGWRIGAMVGSEDFIADMSDIKGNIDSGFNAALATGVLATLEKDMVSAMEVRAKYLNRMNLLVTILAECGMQLAIKPEAGFFTLWDSPIEAFGKKINDSKEFNFAMIENTGVVGVHFDPFYIRYSVAALDIAANADAIREAFMKARVKY